MITPTAEIKALDPELFEEAKEGDPDEFLSKGLINEHQLKRYRDFLKIEPIKILTQELNSSNDIDDLFEIAQKKLTKEQFRSAMESVAAAMIKTIDKDKE